MRKIAPSDEGSGAEARGFARSEVLRRRTGPGPDVSRTSMDTSSAGSCDKSAISHVFSCSGADSIAEIQGSRSKATAAPKVSKRQSVRGQWRRRRVLRVLGPRRRRVGVQGAGDLGF